MKKYLITGGAGFIGSNLANSLSKNNKVIIIDDLSMGKEENINKSDNVTFIKGSITDNILMEKLLNDNSFDYIYHLAAIASVADSIDRPLETSEVNLKAVLDILEIVRSTQKELKRFVFASSAAVYGDEETLPKYEESTIRPLTPYAIDKFAAEKYVLAYNNLYDVPTSAVRFFNVYGPNQNPASPYSGVISILVDKLKNTISGNKDDFIVFGDGEQSRDFVFVKDVINALIIVANNEESRGEVFNVATGNSVTLNELVSLSCEILDVDLKTVHKEKRLGDIDNSLANVDKLLKLNYNPQYDIRSGLKEYLEYEIKR